MRIKAVMYIVLAGLFWGTSGIFVHYLSPLGFTPFMMSAVRALVSFIAMALYALIFDVTLFKCDIKSLLLSLVIGASLWGTATSYYTAMTLTGTSVAVVLMYTAPVYVALFGAIFMKERLTRGGIAAVVLMLLGCVLVSGVLTSSLWNAAGIAIGVLSGIVYALYNITTKAAVCRGTRPVTVTLWSFLFMALIAIPFASPIELVSNAAAEPHSIILLLGLGICTFVVPYFLYTLGMRTLDAGLATALGIVEPMAATLFGILFLGDRPDAFAVIGMVLIVGAVLLLAAAEIRASRTAAPAESENEEATV